MLRDFQNGQFIEQLGSQLQSRTTLNLIAVRVKERNVLDGSAVRICSLLKTRCRKTVCDEPCKGFSRTEIETIDSLFLVCCSLNLLLGLALARPSY